MRPYRYRWVIVCWVIALGPCFADDRLAAVQQLIAAGRYVDAEDAGLKLAAALEAERGAMAVEIADALELVLDARRMGGRLIRPGTLDMAERALRIKEAAWTPDDPRLAATLVIVANVRGVQRQLDAAQEALDRALVLRERALGPDHIDVAAVWNAFGLLGRYRASQTEAAAAAERALAIARRLEDPPARQTAFALDTLASVARASLEFERALEFEEQVLAIVERQYGPEHPAIVNTLFTLSEVTRETGDLERSRALHHRAIGILEAAPGSEYRMALALILFASGLQISGDYPAALSTIERALPVVEKATGPSSPLMAAALEQLASTYAALGDHAAAARIRQQTVALWTATHGPDSLHVGTSLKALADSYEQAGQIEAAFDTIDRALAILSKGKEPMMYSEALLARGRLLLERARFEEARIVLDQARQVSAGSSVTFTRFHYATSTVLLARVERQTGHPARAVPLYREAIAGVEQEFGLVHPTAAGWRTELAATLAEAGEIEEARRLLVSGEQASLDHLRLISRTLTDRRALSFAATRVSGVDLAVTLATHPAAHTRRDIDLALDLVIQGRTIVLDEMAARQRAVVAEQSSLRAPWTALNRARTRLANLIVGGPEGQSPERYQQLVEGSRAQRDRAERELAEASVAFRQEQSRARAGLQEVRAQLPAGAAIVSYVRYVPKCLAAGRAPHALAEPLREPPSASVIESAAQAARDICRGSASSAEASYAAFITRRGQPVRAVRLGRAEEIEAAIAAWQEAIQGELSSGGLATRRTETTYRDAGRALRARVWDHLQPHLAGATMTFIVPDGALHLVDLATLPTGRAGYLVDAPFTLHYLLAERDLVQTPFHPTTTSLLALGAPTFANTAVSGTASASASNASASNISPSPIGPSSPQVSSDSTRTGAAPPTPPATTPWACEVLSTRTFDALPGTRQEIEQIASLWRQGQGQGDAASGASSSPVRTRDGSSSTQQMRDTPRTDEVIILADERATEVALKELARGRRVLHLATHGFSIDRFCGRSVRNGAAAGPLIEENPLLRSGLVLAGANQRGQAGTDDEDGILTAEEIAGLDLTAAQWAVLSACDTGRGDWQAREGVLGLRRAFEVAGARTVVLSLWAVLDSVTSEWMTALYRGKFVHGRSTAAAVRAANRTLLADRRARGLSTHPLYWSGFIASGDWR